MNKGLIRERYWDYCLNNYEDLDVKYFTRAPTPPIRLFYVNVGTAPVNIPKSGTWGLCCKAGSKSFLYERTYFQAGLCIAWIGFIYIFFRTIFQFMLL